MLAIELADVENDVDLSTSLADKAVIEALFNSDITTAKFIVEKYPMVQVKYINFTKLISNLNDFIIY